MDFYQPISLTASTTLSKRTHAGTLLKTNAAAGLTLTLPAAAGSGTVFSILVETAITSNNLVIQVANASDTMTGVAILGQDSADTAVHFTTGASDDTITMNGSTTGGLKGDRIVLVDAGSNLWAVSIVGTASGTEATPFSAAVS